MAPKYDVVSRESWLRRFSASPLPTGGLLWHKANDGLWWSGKICGRQDAAQSVRLLDDAGSRPLHFLRIVIQRRSTPSAALGAWKKIAHVPTGRTHAPQCCSGATQPPPLPSTVPVGAAALSMLCVDCVGCIPAVYCEV